MRSSVIDLRIQPLQVLLTNQLQAGALLDILLEYTGAANLTISTFSTGEEFLRKLLRLRKSGRVKTAHLYTDVKAAEKTARTRELVSNAYDRVCYCANHSKVMIVEGELLTAVVLTSQNQTRGNRLENYCIVADIELAQSLKKTLQEQKTYEICRP